MENTVNSDLLLSLAKRVKELRSIKGVTQEQATTDTGIHFGRIEQGKRDVTISTIQKLSSYFGVSMHEFLKDF